ncbi:zinc-dependent peptidase [Arenimonas sp.]|uniref:M90 family metallopeptidase n=1 Tax=Arenimonas sp. TaxID=1872635 RepID=UPI0035B3BB5E
MKSLLRRLRAAAAPPSLSEAQIAKLQLSLPFLDRLAPGRLQRLHALAARFLGEKTITPLQGLELDERQRLQLACLACLPLIEFGAEGLHGWKQVLVYPGAFRVHRRHHDEDTGVVAEWVDELAGESWDLGPLVLSWDDVQADLADPEAGYQLVVHEMAHKIDFLDGAMDGTPPLPAAWQREWARDFQAAYDTFCARVDRGEQTPIDAYAAEAPEEFFAVASEYHFSAPALLKQEMPAVAAHLQRFYGDSPIPG